MADRSLNERQRLVQAAVQQARGSSECYVTELYDDRAVITVYAPGADNSKNFEYSYTIADDDTVSLGDPTEVVQETTYRPAAVKFVAPDTIEGLAFPFGLVDTDGETFTKSTDLCEDWFPNGRPLLYNHGLDRAHKAARVGRQTEYEEREGGIWAQAQLEANARYRKHIDRLIEEGTLGYSSGAYAHLATKNTKGELTRWPWVELSLTPMPANPATLGVHYIKSADFLDLFDEAVPPAVKAAVSALDEWASRDSTAGLVTGSLEEKAGRATAAATELRDHVMAYAAMRAKTGRVLSAQTRERLLRHPASLRELAEDLDGLLSEADAEKTKSVSSVALDRDVAETLMRAALVASDL